ARFAREAHGHGLLFISSPRGPCGKRETCVAPPRTDTVSDSCLREKARRSSGNGGRSGSRGFNGFGKARAASVGGGGDPGHGVCSEILFSGVSGGFRQFSSLAGDRKSTRLNSSHVAISYAVFCLKKKNNK